MSESSRMLKPSEEAYLPLAQLKATELDYRSWVIWMRQNFAYSLAVRMCIFMGHKLPGHGFYQCMRDEGMKRQARAA